MALESLGPSFLDAREVLNLQGSQVDLVCGVIRLEASASRDKKPRRGAWRSWPVSTRARMS